MGADGGSIPDRRDLVKTKGKAEQTDKALKRERFYLCQLSRKPLAKPIFADPLGRLFNKDAVIVYLLDNSAYGDGGEILRYIKTIKDFVLLNLMPNPARDDDADATSASRAPFVCWLSFKEMTGAVPFIALRSCGCVFSETAIKAVVPNLAAGSSSNAGGSPAAQVPCPNCGKEFDPTPSSVTLPINPPEEVQDALLDALNAVRAAAAAAKAEKQLKAANRVRKRRDMMRGEMPPAKVARLESSSTPNSGNSNSNGNKVPRLKVAASVAPSSVGSSVKDKLAEQERKRVAAQAGMSDAVKSMFRSKTDEKNDTADFFGRTFNRYAA